MITHEHGSCSSNAAYLERSASCRMLRCFVGVASCMAIAAVTIPATARGAALDSSLTTSNATAPGESSGPLRVEVEPSIDDAGLLPGWILDRHPNADAEIPTAEGHEQWIVVTIGGATYDYRVSVVAMRDGAPVGAAKEPEACECNGEELLARVDAGIAEAAEALRVASSAAVVVPTPAEVEPTHEAAEGEGARAKDPVARPLRLRTMGYVGIGATVLGVGLLAAGIPLARRPDEIRGGMGQIETRSPREAGIGLAVSGSVAVAAGVSMVVLDLVRSRSRAVAVVPVVGPRQLGVGLTWRARGRVRQ